MDKIETTTGEKPIEHIQNKVKEAAKAETSTSPVRRYRAALFQVTLLVLVASFSVLTYLVSTIPSFPIDLKVTLAVQTVHSPLFAGLMTFISWVGFSPQALIFSVVIVFLLYSFGFHWEAVVALIGAVFVEVVNLVVKVGVHRPRPSADLVKVVDTLNSYSFPSGHVMYYTGFFGFICFLAFTLLKPSWKRTLLLVIFGIHILLVGVSRIYLGGHWASDVLGAYLLGSLSLIAVIQLYRWGKPRYFVRQPAAKEK